MTDKGWAANSGSREPDPSFTGSGPSGFDPGRAAWADPRLAYIYLQASRVAETMPEDSPQEQAVRMAMSKLDEADMHIKGIEVVA